MNFISFNDFQKAAKQGTNALSQIKFKPSLLDAAKQIISSKTDNEDKVELSKTFDKAKRQNGLIEKIADKIKSLTGLGYSSKKIQSKIDNNASSDEIKKDIKNYRRSQENVAQTTGDVASGLAAMTVFFKGKQFIQTKIAQIYQLNEKNVKAKCFDKMKTRGVELKKELKDEMGKYVKEQGEKLAEKIKASANAEKLGLKDKLQKLKIDFVSKNAEKIANTIGENYKKLGEKLPEILNSKKTPIIIAAIAAMIIGGIIKSDLLKLNRIGTKQYKPDINKDTMSKKEIKKEIKKAKKEAKRAKKNANFRNFVTGALNGITTPIIMLGGGIGGVLYAGVNSLSRYFIGSREDRKDKSIHNYVENLKASPVTNAIGALALAIPAVAKGKGDKIFNQNFEKALEKIKNAQLEEKYSSQSSFYKLHEVLFADPKIKEIMEDESLTNAQKIQKLSDENIFALKFKQIMGNSDELAKALKTDCPPTRTIEEANSLVQKVFGNSYTVTDCVGVGTVAETYLAKDSGGKEVCIKMLKDGITLDKISKDEETFVEMIKGLTDKSTEEKEFLIKNIRNIAQGVKQEIDFTNEANAAKALKKVTHQAKVVVPMEVKDGLYVMEKADGVSLQKLMEYLEGRESLQSTIDRYTRELEKATKESDKICYAEYLREAKEKLVKFESHTKGCEEIGELTKEEAKKLLEKYQDVLIEQFNQVDEKGKIIHGDIHPGNIFVDIPAMRRGDKNFFTLIDTGNTIQQSSESAIRFLNLSKYIKNADTENITKFALEGAKLPDGMTKEEAFKKINEELHHAFFDDKTELGIVSNDSILGITESIMQKLGIIPADTQGNLMKAKTSANQSLSEFIETFFSALGKQVGKKMEGKEGVSAETTAMAEIAKAGFEITALDKKNAAKIAQQEKLNLTKMSPILRAAITKSPSAPKKNSEEYLTYILKQYKMSPSEDISENLVESMGLSM